MFRRGTTAVMAALLLVCGMLVAALPAAAQSSRSASGRGAAGGEGEARHKPRFVVAESQFERMFPDRDPFFTYDGLVEATEATEVYPAFARTGGRTTRKQEAAAFLANVSHETGGLFYVVSQNPDMYPIFCDDAQPYGCPAGRDAYYGRGAIMLSWNFNYKAAGDALGVDLLNNPWLVETDPAVAWMTALWYWNTQSGPGTMTGHDAMVNKKGFGQTIWSLNGSAECEGGNPAQMEHRVELYKQFTRVLRTAPGRDLTC
ncbi:Chitinase class I [Streptomyces sp. S4.7]|uniref:chitinase n=1 Tax=Streptomyces sp. S4.7 TaxID=2705439 RepID=UPI001398B3B6|nr:Chitinase class I [Streptomyces sp. S4.7]